MNKQDKGARDELSKPERDKPFDGLSNVAILSLCHFMLIDVESEYDLRFAIALHAEADVRKLRAEENSTRKWNRRKFTSCDESLAGDRRPGPVTLQDEL